MTAENLRVYLSRGDAALPVRFNRKTQTCNSMHMDSKDNDKDKMTVHFVGQEVIRWFPLYVATSEDELQVSLFSNEADRDTAAGLLDVIGAPYAFVRYEGDQRQWVMNDACRSLLGSKTVEKYQNISLTADQWPYAAVGASSGSCFSFDPLSYEYPIRHTGPFVVSLNDKMHRNGSVTEFVMKLRDECWALGILVQTDWSFIDIKPYRFPHRAVVRWHLDDYGRPLWQRGTKPVIFDALIQGRQFQQDDNPTVVGPSTYEVTKGLPEDVRFVVVRVSQNCVEFVVEHESFGSEGGDEIVCEYKTIS